MFFAIGREMSFGVMFLFQDDFFRVSDEGG